MHKGDQGLSTDSTDGSTRTSVVVSEKEKKKTGATWIISAIVFSTKSLINSKVMINKQSSAMARTVKSIQLQMESH